VYLSRDELGKGINTDEAAALGAVYQAANLGKGFKVKKFGIKDATIYPIKVSLICSNFCRCCCCGFFSFVLNAWTAYRVYIAVCLMFCWNFVSAVADFVILLCAVYYICEVYISEFGNMLCDVCWLCISNGMFVKISLSSKPRRYLSRPGLMCDHGKLAA